MPKVETPIAWSAADGSAVALTANYAVSANDPSFVALMGETLIGVNVIVDTLNDGELIYLMLETSPDGTHWFPYCGGSALALASFRMSSNEYPWDRILTIWDGVAAQLPVPKLHYELKAVYVRVQLKGTLKGGGVTYPLVKVLLEV